MSAANIFPQRSPNGNSPATQAFLNRLIPLPPASMERLYQNLIDGLASANIALDCLFLFAVRDFVSACTDVVTVRYGGWLQSFGAFTANQGVSPQGSTSIFDTQFNLLTATNFQQNSACLFGWNLGTSSVGYDIGSGAAPESHISCRNSLASNYTQWAINSASEVDSGVLVSDPTGFWLANRTGSTTSALYRNGALIATAGVASVSPSNATLQLASDNSALLAALGAGAALNGTQLGTSGTGSLYGLLRTFLLGVGLNV